MSLAFPAVGQDAAAMTEPLPEAAAEPPAEAVTEPVATGPIAVTDQSLEQYLWENRVLVVFADTPLDPAFIRQMELLADRPSALEERSIVVLTDTEPVPKSAIRIALRPRGFAMVIVDKDGRVILRKPSPWDLREISRAVDKTPLRQQELRDARDAEAAARGLAD
jgi:hypothetical protein